VRLEKITDRGFITTMLLTGFLTAGVAFAVFLFMLKRGDVGAARTYAFTVLVYAELFRSFGNRSETKPLWRIPFLSNLNLVVVVSVSFGLQVFSHHSEMLGRILRTSRLPFSEGVWLVAAGLMPLVVLEVVKMIRVPAREE